VKNCYTSRYITNMYIQRISHVKRHLASILSTTCTKDSLQSVMRLECCCCCILNVNCFYSYSLKLFYKSKSVIFFWFQCYTYNYINQRNILSFNDTLILISESTPLLIKIAERILINDHSYKYSTANQWIIHWFRFRE